MTWLFTPKTGFLTSAHDISGRGDLGRPTNLYYVKVADKMKMVEGGGIEKELIEIVEVPVAEGRKLVMGESILRLVGMMFAITWFYDHIYGRKKLSTK